MYRLSVALVGLFRIAESICTYAHQSDGRTFGYHAVLSCEFSSSCTWPTFRRQSFDSLAACSTSVAQVFGYNESGNYSRSFLSQMAAPSYVALEVCGSSYVSGTEIGTWEYTSLLNQKWWVPAFVSNSPCRSLLHFRAVQDPTESFRHCVGWQWGHIMSKYPTRERIRAGSCAVRLHICPELHI